MGKAWPQYILTIISNIGPLCFGLHIGWLAPLEPTLKSPATPLTRILTDEDVSWVAALPTAALLLATPIFGWLLQRFGRKPACLAANLPNIVAFALFLFSRHFYLTLFGRFLAGFASAGALIVTPVYVSECVDESRRGVLCGLSALFINIGVAVTFGVGSYCSYATVNIVCLLISTIFVVGYFWIPETPVHLVRMGETEKALKSLRKLRGGQEDLAYREIEVIQADLKVTDSESSSSGIKAVLADRGLRKALVLGFGIMTFQQLSGIAAALAYLVQILNDASCFPSASMVTLFIGVIQLISSLIGPLLLVFFGRKTILLASAVVMTAALGAFTLHLYFLPAVTTLLPSVALSIFFTAYSVGYGTVPFALLPEIVPVEARGVIVAIVGTWVGILSFAVTKFYPILNQHITIAGAFTGYTILSVFGSFFIFFCLFETKGKKIHEIYDILKFGSAPLS